MFGNKKKVSLILGGGGTKGFIHIGVLRYLEEQNYTITDVAGTSIGALIGALIAMGRTSDEIYTKIQTLSSKDIIDIDRQYITIGGTSIISQLEDMIGDAQIEDLPRPFTAIATDLDSGEEIVLTSGSVLDAVRYSISVPGVFSLHDQEKPIVDGGIINNLPINHASSKRIIASSCRGYGGFALSQKKQTFLGMTLPHHALTQKKDILTRSLIIMMRRIEDLQLANHPRAKLIRPYTGDFSPYDMSILEEAVERGYDEAKKILG